MEDLLDNGIGINWLDILDLLDRIAKNSKSPRSLPDDISHMIDEKHAI